MDKYFTPLLKDSNPMTVYDGMKVLVNVLEQKKKNIQDLKVLCEFASEITSFVE